MKILFVTINPNYRYDQPAKTGWNLLPSLFSKEKVKVRGLGKYDIHKFFIEYYQFKPDIIIVEWPPSCFFIPLFKKLKLVNCPIIFNWGDYYAEMMTNYPKIIVKFMENYAIKNTDYITTVSKRNEKIAKKYDKKVFFIPHGYFKSDIKSNISLDKIKTKKDNLKVVYLGDQSKWKKVDKLIKAVKDLDCDLFLIGKPNPEFQKIAPKNAHFIGYVPELEVHSLLKQADILVNTSNQDCNYKLSEYIFIGKPLLAHDGLARNVFKHKINAYLTKDFKKGLIELINDQKLRQNLEKNIKNIPVYSWGEITHKYLNLFKKIKNKEI